MQRIPPNYQRHLILTFGLDQNRKNLYSKRKPALQAMCMGHHRDPNRPASSFHEKGRSPD